MMMTNSRAYQTSLITKLGLLFILSLLLNVQGLKAQNFEKKVAEITKGLYNGDGSPRSQKELIDELKQTRYILTYSTKVYGAENHGGFEYKTNENGEFSELRALRKNGGNYFYQEMDYAFRGRTCYLEEANKRQGLLALGNGYVAQFTINDFLDPKSIDRPNYRGTKLYSDETAITINSFATTPEQQAEFHYQLYLVIRKYIEGCQDASGKVKNREGYTTSYTFNIDDKEVNLENPDYAGRSISNNNVYMLCYNRVVDDHVDIYNVFPANPNDENPKIEYRSIPISSMNRSLLDPFVKSKYLYAVSLYIQTVSPFQVIRCLADGGQFTLKNEYSANCEFNSDRFADEYPSDAFRTKIFNSGAEMHSLSADELAAKAEREANADIFDFGKSCNSDVSLLSLDGSTIFMMSTYGEDHIDVSDSDDEIYLYNDKAILKTRRGESVLFTRKNRDFYDATGSLVYTVKGNEIFVPSISDYVPAYVAAGDGIYKGQLYNGNKLCSNGIKSCTMVTMAYLFYFRP